MKNIFACLAMLAIITISGCVAGPAKDYSQFTSCLTENGIKEYGAYWCPNCARVKLTLGDAWKNLDYVECDPKCVPDAAGKLPDFCLGFESHTDECLQMGIEKYPSWVKGNEILYVGTELNEVAKVSGCTLPE